MENVAKDAMRIANNWLLSAELEANGNNFNIALYSLEMALEISVKAVLLEEEVNFPKKHDVIDQFKDLVNNKKKFSMLKADLPEIIRIYSELLASRNTAGYGFSPIKNDFKAEVEETLPIVKKLINLLASVIES